MDWTGKTHPLERMAEWGAPLVLASAAGWAASFAGLSLAANAACIGVALAVGMIAMRMAGASPMPGDARFEPVPFGGSSADDELLLDYPLDEDELLLDDPLVEIPADSRVVQLFARQDPTPGELVLRISDFLNDGVRAPMSTALPAAQGHPDASAALHDALANIRASLR